MIHPEYERMIDAWTNCRDWSMGAFQVKSKRERYLPPLDIHRAHSLSAVLRGKSSDYASYLMRARPFEAYKHTLAFFVGLVFARPVTMTGDALLPTDDMDTHYNSASSIHRDVLREILTTSRGAAFVDWDDYRGRPYVRLYKAEQLTDWDYDESGNLILVDIQEEYFDRDAEEPAMAVKTIELRVEGGAYVVRESTLDDQGNRVVIPGSERVPEIPTASGTEPLDEIPLTFFSASGLESVIDQPALYGIVELSCGHYIVDADLRHGAALSARPTVYTSGHLNDDQEYILGSSTAWNLPEGASVGMIQFEGKPLEILMKMKEADERNMAALGAKMLEPPRRMTESAESLQLQIGGNASSLNGLVQTSVLVMRWIFRWMNRWLGLPEDSFEYEIDRNFVPSRMTPEELNALMDGVDRGRISEITFLENIKRGGILSEEREIDDERAFIGQNTRVRLDLLEDIE